MATHFSFWKASLLQLFCSTWDTSQLYYGTWVEFSAHTNPVFTTLPYIYPSLSQINSEKHHFTNSFNAFTTLSQWYPVQFQQNASSTSKGTQLHADVMTHSPSKGFHKGWRSTVPLYPRFITFMKAGMRFFYICNEEGNTCIVFAELQRCTMNSCRAAINLEKPSHSTLSNCTDAINMSLFQLSVHQSYVKYSSPRMQSRSFLRFVNSCFLKIQPAVFGIFGNVAFIRF